MFRTSCTSCMFCLSRVDCGAACDNPQMVAIEMQERRTPRLLIRRRGLPHGG